MSPHLVKVFLLFLFKVMAIPFLFNYIVNIIVFLLCLITIPPCSLAMSLEFLYLVTEFVLPLIQLSR